MTIMAIGLDLAKNVFAIHSVDATGQAVLIKPTVKRDVLLALIAKLPPCLIGMETCRTRITGPGNFKPLATLCD